jgi:tetratricopeptide (TPR) repeat protein
MINGAEYSFQEAAAAYQRLQSRLSTDSPEQTLAEITTFLKIYPDFPTAHNDLGVLYYQIGDKLRSLANYEKAGRLQPDNLITRKNLAEFYYLELGWVDDAMCIYTELHRLAPDDSEVLFALGAISYSMGNLAASRKFYTQVLELDPLNSTAREAIAKIDSQNLLTERSSANAEIKPSQSAPPAPPQPPAAEKTDLNTLLAQLRSAVGSNQTTAEPQVSADEMYQTALRHANSGDDQQAIATLERLITASPNYGLAFNDLGVLYSRNGDIQASVRNHERAVAVNPDNPMFKKNLANLYYSILGRTDEAIAIFTALVKDFPNDIEVLSALAIICTNNNLADQAQTFLRRVLDLEPWNKEARQLLNDLTSA